MNATVRYLKTLEEMQAAAVNELIADGGVPTDSNDGPAARKVKIGSNAQKALTPEQRKNRAKSARRAKRKANGGLTTKDAREVEAFMKFLRASGRTPQPHNVPREGSH